MFQGGTFTISNLGMFGIKEFTTLQKIIEQPEYMNIGLPPVVRNVRTAMQI
jgi:pyruvate/2-oxoglutarate dehydrogenase complex dihydrolipoamide acyltransferase (E2) component